MSYGANTVLAIPHIPRRAMELDPRSEDAEAALVKVEATLAASCLQHELPGHAGVVHCLAIYQQVGAQSIHMWLTNVRSYIMQLPSPHVQNP